MQKMIVVICICAIEIFSFSGPADMYFEKGMKSNDKEEKINNFTLALKLNPTFQNALIERAEIYFEMNNILEAENDLINFEKNFNKNDRYFTLKGKIAERNGLLDQASLCFDKALENNDKNDEANLRKGISLITLGELQNNSRLYKDAISFFKKVTVKSKFYVLSLLNMAKCYEYEENYNEARKMYNTLINSEKNVSSYFFHLGRLQYISEEYNDAILNLEKAATLSYNERTENHFYLIFKYYIDCYKLNNQKAALYDLNLNLDKYQVSALGELFQDKITCDEFILKIKKEQKWDKIPGNRLKLLESECNCQLGYYFLLKGEIEKALDYFNKAKDYNKFGAYSYYLSRFESQRINLTREFKK